MVQGGGGARFAPKSFEGSRIVRQVLRQKFQGDKAVQKRVFRLEYYSHATASNFFQDAIV
jgi:hypothetical protein